jgi:ABC-type multidrug transport system ATPase subunit
MTVKVRSLQKIYQTGQSAVGGISFGIGKNEVLGLLGPNGAGKSTTFSMLTMEIPKTNGEIEIMNT